MSLDPTPPRPGLVTTRKAALLYGARKDSLLRAMHTEGVVPVLASSERGGRCYWWDPADVLRVRGIRSGRVREAQRILTARSKAGERFPDPLAARLKARHTRLETFRQKLLARIKERQYANQNA